MAEADIINTAPPRARFGAVPLSIGLVLTALAGVDAALIGGATGGLLAAIAGLLAQPAFALAARGGRFALRDAGRDALPILALWALALSALFALPFMPLALTGVFATGALSRSLTRVSSGSGALLW